MLRQTANSRQEPLHSKWKTRKVRKRTGRLPRHPVPMDKSLGPDNGLNLYSVTTWVSVFLIRKMGIKRNHVRKRPGSVPSI